MEQLSVKINNLIKNYGSKEVLNIEELSTYQTDRIGIVGANGQGKSTLLKLIAGVVDPDSGTIQKENSFHYFPQIAEVTEKTDALDWALFGRFSIPTNELATLSGGEETKYRLAQTLSSYQLGLLLDEPTTHLDQQGIHVLIEELQYYYGTLIVVSHDRYLLNQLATKIWEVDQGKVTEYAGNYDSYRQQKEQAAQRIDWEAAQYQQQKQQLTQAIQKKKEQAIKSSRISEKSDSRTSDQTVCRHQNKRHGAKVIAKNSQSHGKPLGSLGRSEGCRPAAGDSFSSSPCSGAA